jgi:hypothetical protein
MDLSLPLLSRCPGGLRLKLAATATDNGSMGSVTGICLAKRLLIQSSDQANRVNSALPTWPLLIQADWSIGLAIPHLGISMGIQCALGPACLTSVPLNRENHPISLWPLQRLACWSL